MRLPDVYCNSVMCRTLPIIGSSSSTLVPGGIIPSRSNFKNNFPYPLTSAVGFVITVYVKLSTSTSSESL
jgi:hypothetical protein